jgi:hypothetical protein
VDKLKTVAKRVLLTLIVGAACAMLIAFFLAPGLIEWYATPGIPTVCSCSEQIQWAFQKMRTSLSVAGFVGAVVAVAAVELFRRFRGQDVKDPGAVGAKP